MSKTVLIAGGGPAALEAVIVLRRRAGERVSTTLLAPDTHLSYRPLSVLEPFTGATPVRYELAQIARDQNCALRAGRLSAVDCFEHTAILDDGALLGYDMLLLATGALMRAPFPNALAFGRGRRDTGSLGGLLRDMESGSVRRVSFVVPLGCTWPLPLYELALMLARRAFDSRLELTIDLITPEPEPLGVFGAPAAEEVADLIGQAGIRLERDTVAAPVDVRTLRLADGREIQTDRTVTLALPHGPHIPGLPADADGFVPCDRHGCVQGVPDVYAAGDVTSFAIKQGGLACQQADAAAESIAAAAGARVDPQPFTPVLRGVLLTEAWSRFLRREEDEIDGVIAERALWSPPSKLAGRELSRYLELLDARAGRRTLIYGTNERGGTPVTFSAKAGVARPVELLAQFGANPDDTGPARSRAACPNRTAERSHAQPAARAVRQLPTQQLARSKRGKAAWSTTVPTAVGRELPSPGLRPSLSLKLTLTDDGTHTAPDGRPGPIASGSREAQAWHMD